jgi:hypothetical protein
MSTVRANNYYDASGGSAAQLYGVSMRNGGTAFVNRIINGDMRIDQRNAGAAVTTNDALPVDRFRLAFGNSSGAFSGQQTTTAPAGFVNSLKYTTTTADASLGATEYATLYQIIEGLNVADLAWGTASAATVTLSFWCRSSQTGTFGGSLRNSSGARSYPFSYSISVANTWEQKSVTIAGDTSGTWLTTNGIGVYINWSMGAGSTLSGTAGAWAAANYIGATGAVNLIATLNADFYITGVQLEAGTVASPFERRDYGREFDMCRRYYERFTNSGFYATGGAMYANQPRFCVTYYPKRAVPSFGSSAASTFIVQGNGTNQTPSGFSVAGQDTTNTYFYPTGTTLAVGLSAALGNGTTSYLEFPAEL